MPKPIPVLSEDLRSPLDVELVEGGPFYVLESVVADMGRRRVRQVEVYQAVGTPRASKPWKSPKPFAKGSKPPVGDEASR